MRLFEIFGACVLSFCTIGAVVTNLDPHPSYAGSAIESGPGCEMSGDVGDERGVPGDELLPIDDRAPREEAIATAPHAPRKLRRPVRGAGNR